MYDILYSYVDEEEDSAFDWGIMEENISFHVAMDILESNIVQDMSAGNQVAYRVVEHGTWMVEE